MNTIARLFNRAHDKSSTTVSSSDAVKLEKNVEGKRCEDMNSQLSNAPASASEAQDGHVRNDGESEMSQQQHSIVAKEIDTSAITGLRAITALQIACGHWLLFFGNNSNPYLDFQGGIAVSTFFLITGFVMQVGYSEKVESPRFHYWEFIKRRYVRMLPLHWFALAWYAPFIAINYRTIANDYNFWQNKSGEINLIMGIVLTPFLMHSWIFSLCYWNSVCWSLSCQLGYYFTFPWLSRKLNMWSKRFEENAAKVSPTDAESQSDEDKFGAVQKSYRKYIWYAYHASYAAPLTLIGALNSPTFRNIWRDEHFEARAHAVVTALDNDLDGMRAYFCGRAWFPVRIPLFFMGMLLGAMRLRLARYGVKTDVERFWTRFTDFGSLFLGTWLITCIVCSGIVSDSKNIRIFNEFFLTAPVAFWLYGVTIARNSYTVRALRHPVPQALGTWSFAMYLLQFPLFTSWAAFEYDTMHVFPECDRTSPNVHVWADCFHNFSSETQLPNVVVIAFIFFLVLVAFLCHHVIEKPANKLMARLLFSRR